MLSHLYLFRIGSSQGAAGTVTNALLCKTESDMTIGIIGAGALGSNIARAFAKARITATIANSRGPESLADLVAEVGPTLTAGTLAEAASADIVVLGLRWSDAEAVLRTLPAWQGRIVIDATNPVSFLAPDSPERSDPNNPLAVYGIKPVHHGRSHSSQVIADLLPGARVVKAFNHLDASALVEPETAGGQRVLFYSGDSADAKVQVGGLLAKMGFFAVDLGPLDVGAPLAELPFGPLAAGAFVKI
jgi:8-hydroxy-5-deazaflavin:NADPH oxidoreductase